MSNKQIKQLRGQLRQLVQELLPELLTEQLIEAMERRLTGQLREGLGKIDQRQSDLQSYFVRNSGVPTAPTKPAQE